MDWKRLPGKGVLNQLGRRSLVNNDHGKTSKKESS